MATEQTEVRAAVTAGAQAAKLKERMATLDGIPIVLANGDQKVIVPREALELIAERQGHPARASGVSVHHQLDSFTAHVNRNKRPSTTLWADVEDQEVQAIYNYHGAEPEENSYPGWLDYRARYSMPTADAWDFWTGKAGDTMHQDEFGDLIEERMDDLTSGEGYPKPAALLEMARNLKIHTAGQFTRSVNPTTGESALVCKTEHTQDSTKIPRAFQIGIPVFRSGVSYAVECRIRFRLQHGNAIFSFEVHREREILLDAFSEAVASIESACEGVPVFWGVPEQKPTPAIVDCPF